MGSTISVPKTPGGERIIVGSTMHLKVRTHVVTRDIVPELRCHHVVVHSRVEDGTLAFRTESCLDAGELLVPSLSSSIGNSVEVEALRLLSLHVEQSIRLAGRRKRHLDHHLVTRVNLESRLPVLAVQALAQPVMHRLVELHAEVNNLIISPAMTATIAHQRIIIDRNNTTVASIIANSVLQVDDDASIVAATRESETIESRALGSRHLAHNAETVQQDTIVARHRNLRLMAVITGQTLAAHLQLTISRHQADVAQVATTSAAQVHLAKTDNLLATLVIAGTPVPARLNLRRTSIHHTERHIGTHENMTMVARTDNRIHVLR